MWRFEWNGLDRLVAAHCPDGSRWTYGYDAFARRVFKQCWRRGPERGADGETRIVWQARERHDFLWDGDVVASETVHEPDAPPRMVCWYFEPESFVPLARREGAHLSYVVTDHLETRINPSR